MVVQVEDSHFISGSTLHGNSLSCMQLEQIGLFPLMIYFSYSYLNGEGTRLSHPPP